MYTVVFTGRESAGRKSHIPSSSRGEGLWGENHVYRRLLGASLRGESHVYRRPRGVRVCGAKVTYIVVSMVRESAGRKSSISSSSRGESLRDESHVYRRLHGARVCGAKVHGANLVGPERTIL